MYDKDGENNANGDLVSSEEKQNYLDDNINGDSKGLEEVEELVKEALSKGKIDNVETRSKGKYYEHTTPTRKEEAHNMPAVGQLFNVSYQTKEFERFKCLIRCKNLSEVFRRALYSFMQLEISERYKVAAD